MKNIIIPYNPKLKQYARSLRNNSTLSEVLIWKQIKRKSLGVEFHRQVPVDRYIVDFYCHELMLAIEIDGSSHNNKYDSDMIRQQRLEDLGIHFIRFTNISVNKHMDDVLRDLALKIKELQEGGHPPDPLQRGKRTSP
jgi:very-short-patch-repair endonuclease